MAKNNTNANTWTTAEQRDFLNARWPEYLEIYNSPKARYNVFWAQLKESWFKVYPEIKHLFPHIASATDLSVDQEKELSAAVLIRVEQLKRWYQWKASSLLQLGGRIGRKRDPGNTAFEDMKNKRALKPAEMYSKCGEYKLKVKHRTNELIEEMKTENDGKLPRGGVLKAVKKASKELYDAESDDVKEKVLALIQEEARIKEEEMVEQKNRTPEQYLKAIKETGDYLHKHLGFLAERTGWSFSVMMGGPHPGANGTIAIASFHKGLTPLGSDFGTTPKFIDNCMVPFTAFLEDVYPLSVRESRSLLKKDRSDDDSFQPFNDGDALIEKKPDTARAPSPVIPHTTSSTSTASSSKSLLLAPLNQGVPALTSSDADSVAGRALASGGAPKALPNQPQTNNPDGNNPASMASGTLTFDGNPQPALDFGNMNQDENPLMDRYPMAMADRTPTWNGVQQCSLVYANAGPYTGSMAGGTLAGNGLPPSVSMSTVGSSMAGGNTNDFNFGSDVVDPLFNADFNADFSLNTMDAEPYNELDLFLRSHPPPTTEPYPNQLVLPPVNGDDMNRHLASQVPKDLFNFGPGPANDAMANTQPVGSSLPAVFALGSSDARGDISMTDSVLDRSATSASLQCLVVSPLSPIGLASTASPTVPSAPASSAAVHGTMHVLPSAPLSDITRADQVADNDQLNPADARRSRSGRTVVPSKRAELLNMIGENSKVQASAKENIPLLELPTWALLAKAHLLSRDLGDEWKACVEEWSALEIKLINSHAKGALPAISLRPEEWTKWVGKSSQGNRRYDAIPFIADSAELGVAIVKWWHAMQPGFRQSADRMPSPTYVASEGSNWDALKKSGPNGLVSVMTLIVWWGQALADRSPYQDDSTDMWKEMVSDVQASIQAIAAAPSAPQKRKVTAGKENVSKRARSS